MRSTSITAAPKSKSGPFSVGQLAPPPRQAAFQASFASAWNDQRLAPVFRSSAKIASLVSVAGEEEFWPVPKYSTPRFASMVGLFQTTAPLGPHICTPSRLRWVFAACGVVSKRHTGWPVVASSAAMPPWLRQHSCVGRPAAATSNDDIGTYRRPS